MPKVLTAFGSTKGNTTGIAEDLTHEPMRQAMPPLLNAADAQAHGLSP